MRLSQLPQANRNINDGAWVGDLPNLPGIRLKVRGKDCQEAWKLLTEARVTMTDEEWSDPEVQEQLDIRVATEAILLDWEGFEDDSQPKGKDGKFPALKYDPEHVKTLLADPEYFLLRQGIRYASNVVGMIGKQNLESAAKN